MSEPTTDIDVGPEHRLDSFPAAAKPSSASSVATGAIAWPEDIHVKALHLVIGYLLRSGWNQPEAIPQAKAIVNVAAQRNQSGSLKETSMPIERLALSIAMEHVGKSVAQRITVVPTETRHAMRPADVNRLAQPLRWSEWSSTLATKCAAVPTSIYVATVRRLPLRLRDSQSRS
jgi:hypothetical protein